MKQVQTEKQIPPVANQRAISSKNTFDYWLKKHRYYHERTVSFYRSLVPSKSRVLHVQCKNGYILKALDPAVAVGVDGDTAALQTAEKENSNFSFYSEIKHVPVQSFDYILLSFATMEALDIQNLFLSLKEYCHADTRIVIESYNALWAPILSLTQKVGLRRPTALKNWVSFKDLNHFLYLSDLELVTSGAHTLAPIYVPFLSGAINVFAHLPIVNWFCLNQWAIVRPKYQALKKEATVSIVIPCRNEAGNIQAAIARTPELGLHTEFIFVEGHSSDNTLEHIKKVQQENPQKDIKWFVQEGKGKGDAVRLAFEKATGEILIILDADLTTPPEDMPKFYDALVAGRADFINGSRLVYGMESKAMGYLALLANRAIGWLIAWVIGQPITDTLCGTKVLWRRDYQAIARNRKKLGIWDPFGDFDLLFGAAKLNLKIIDLPIHYKNRTYGQTNISRFKEVWFLWWMGIRAWWVLKVRK